jgi:hypothetical protein
MSLVTWRFKPATAADAEAEANNLRTLEEFHNKEFTDKLVKARRMVSDHQLKLKTMSRGCTDKKVL